MVQYIEFCFESLSSLTYKKYVYTTTPSRFSCFSFSRYPRERFEHANIYISPTFQETVGTHLKPTPPVIAAATLNQFN